MDFIHGPMSCREKAYLRMVLVITNCICITCSDICVTSIRYDPSKGMESLDTVWVSRANALQRKDLCGNAYIKYYNLTELLCHLY